MPDDHLRARLTAFIQANLVAADEPHVVDETTPLLQLGVLDSLRTAMLLNFIRDELGTPVSPELINARNFQDVASIAAMVSDLAAHARSPIEPTATSP
jgi:acyl carrier protein